MHRPVMSSAPQRRFRLDWFIAQITRSIKIASLVSLSSILFRNRTGSASDEERPPMSNISRVLSAIEQGDPRPPSNCCRWSTTSCASWPPQKLAQEAPGQTLQATALVHEAYLRLVGRRPGPALGQPRPLLRRRGRGHAPHPRSRAPAATGGRAWRRQAAHRSRGLADLAAPRRETCSHLDEAVDHLGRKIRSAASSSSCGATPDSRSRRRRGDRALPRRGLEFGQWTFVRAWLRSRLDDGERP